MDTKQLINSSDGGRRMIQFGDFKNDEIKGVNLFCLDAGIVSLSICKIPVYGDFEVCNNKNCFLIKWKYFYFGVKK